MTDSRNKILCLWSTLAILLGFLLTPADAQLSQGFVTPPFTAETWAGNLTGARGLVIDDAGDILVVVPGLGGIFALWEEINGSVNRTLVVNSSSLNLNHGITLFQNHLYASSSSTVWRWNYKAGQRSEASGEETMVANINQNEVGVQTTQGHQTRSLAISSKGIMYVSVGSTSNVDSGSFRARIRSFNLSSSIPQGGFDFVAQGVVFADGLRNEVGLGFDGRGRLWGVENGADQLMRSDLGGDIHNDNPAEELNLFDGKVGTFYGYPFCWSEYNLPDGGTGRGSQWAWPSLENNTITDAWCKNTSNVRHPELAMQAHSAPLGVTFFNGTNCGKLIDNLSTNNGTAPGYALDCSFTGDAFVAFHGSWDRDIPVGFKVIRIAFDNSTGLPMSTNDSSAIFDIFGQQKSATECVGDASSTCLRPVDVKIDKKGSLMVTSDATGEIYRITQTVPVVAPTPSPSPLSASSAARRAPADCKAVLLTVFASILLCTLGWPSNSLHSV